MRITRTCLLALVLGGAAGAHAAVILPGDGQDVLKSVADRVHSSVVGVRAQAAIPVPQSGDPAAVVQSPSFGTGVLVGDGLAVTTLHTVGSLLPGRVVPWEHIEVLIADSGPVGATLVGSFPALDLAVLRLEKSAGDAVELAPGSPAVGESLLAMGTDDEAITVVGVNVAAVEGNHLFLSTMRRMDSRYWGGPLFDARGRLAGISLPATLPTALSSGALTGLLENFRPK